MSNRIKILVTGGAGYIGSVTVAKLIQQGYDVVVFDNLYQGHFEAIDSKADFILGDLAQPTDVTKIFDKHSNISGIMHFASNTLVGESMKSPLKYLRDNLVNFTNLIECATLNGINKVILSSTANLFDNPMRLPIESHEKISPGSPYGESKFFCERVLFWHKKIYNLQYIALRYFNACGCCPNLGIGEDHDPETHLIPLILKVALNQLEHINIYGDNYPTSDGTCVRDFVHVSDLAQAHILSLQKLLDGKQVQESYNLGYGKGYSVLDVIKIAREITGHAIPVRISPRREGDPAVLIASPDQAQEELGWNPQFSDLRAIIASAWEWHRSNPLGYKK